MCSIFPLLFFLNSSYYLLNKKCYPDICCCLSSLACALSVLYQIIYVQSLAFSQVSIRNSLTLWMLIEFTQYLEDLKVSGIVNHMAFCLFPVSFLLPPFFHLCSRNISYLIAHRNSMFSSIMQVVLSFPWSCGASWFPGKIIFASTQTRRKYKKLPRKYNKFFPWEEFQ